MSLENCRDSLSRRRWLEQSGLAVGGLTAAALMPHAVTAAPEQERYYVDAHSHIWSPDVSKFPLASGQTAADLQPSSFTEEELLRLVQPLGVRRVVLIQHHIYHGWDNSYLIHAAQTYPDRFRVVGMVDDTQPHPDEIMRQLRPQLVTGFRITSLIRGPAWLEGPGMAAMWKCAAETRQAMCCLINPEDLPGVSRMCEKFPDTPVVIDHFARIGMSGTISETDLRQLVLLAKHPLTHVKISAFYALGDKRPPHHELIPMIRRLVEAYGPQRLMWASDSPYQLQPPNSYAASLELIKGLDFLSADDRDTMLRRTAEKVYFASPDQR